MNHRNLSLEINSRDIILLIRVLILLDKENLIFKI
jgi:hypothetical protein